MTAQLPLKSLQLDNHIPAGQALAAAQAAEAAGITRVWLTEDLFHRGALPLAGAILASTTTLQVGVGVVAAQLRHPAALAMDVRSLLDLGPGRFTLGLGAGVAERARHLMQPASPPLRLVREAIEQVRTLLSGGTVESGGLLHSAERLALSGQPPAGGPCPLYAAAIGPQALAQAGRLADGVVLTAMCAVEHVRHAAGLVQAAAAAAGRPPIPVVAYVPVLMLDDAAAAKAAMRRVLAGYVADWAGLAFLSRLFTEWSPLTPESMDAIGQALRAGDEATLAELLPDEVLDAYTIAGDLPECRRLAARLAAAGATELALSHEA